MCKNQVFWHVKIPQQCNQIPKVNQVEQYMKVLFVTNTDKKASLGEIRKCRPNPKKLTTTELSKHTACGYSFLEALKISMTSTEMKTLRKLFYRFKRSCNGNI